MHSTYEARSIFRALGAGEVSADLATRWAHRKPATSAPTAVSSQEAIRLVQRGLNDLGCAVPETGKMDPLTGDCLAELSGPNWQYVTWLQHAKNVLVAKQQGRELFVEKSAALAGLGEATFSDKLIGFGAVAGILFLAFKLKK